MLTIVVPAQEYFNEETNEFSYSKEMELQLEHSLLSLSKWESIHKKPFLSSNKSTAESLSYVKCMTITHNVPSYLYNFLTDKNIEDITTYINDPMTATTVNDRGAKKDHRIVTAEIIYHWMITLNIPIEFQKWHLNKLMSLIQVCSIENGPKKKMSRKEIFAQNKSLNAARRARLNSKG